MLADVGDVIRLDGVTKTYQHGAPPALAGRASPGGSVDGPQVGSTLPVTGVPGAPALTVVGFADSITNATLRAMAGATPATR